MGRRSRKRVGDGTESGGRAGTRASTRAERDEARRRRAQEATRANAAARERDPRPPAPWGRFPLTELVVLLALILFVLAFIVRGDRGRTMLGAGLALGSLGGLEVTIREHFAGYRSHTTMLAGAVAIVTIVVVLLIVHTLKLWIVALIALAMFCLTFWGARQAFKRRSGGLPFKAGR
jgi:FtsH-binding integral membrane protein